VFDRLCPHTLGRLAHDANELRLAFEGIVCQESESGDNSSRSN
jgi:hypothetical protein